MKIKQKVALHNKFEFEIYDTKTKKTQKAFAYNIVLNSLYAYLVNGGGNYFQGIDIGSGNGALDPARSSVFSLVGRKAATTVETIYNDFDGHITKKIVVSESEWNGTTWTEVGVSNNYDRIYTHAFIKDAEGNQITIQKTDTKIITIYATVYAELVPVMSPLFYTYKGAASILLKMLLSATSCTGYEFHAINGLVFGDSFGCPGQLGKSATSSITGDTANKKTIVNSTRFSVDSGNGNIYSLRLNGIGTILLPAPGIWEKYDFTGVAVGTGDGAIKEFDLPKSFPIPLSEKIYIDGVQMTRDVDYTMHYGLMQNDPWYTGLCDYNSPSGTFYISVKQPPADYMEVSGAIAKQFRLKNDSEYINCYSQFSLWASEDGLAWDTIGLNIALYNGTDKYVDLPAKKYKYFKVSVSGTPSIMEKFFVYAVNPTHKMIQFVNPPASGAAITADFSVDYIPKSSNFVLDVSAEIQFGEGAV